MNTDNESTKVKFETWIKANFGDNISPRLEEFDIEDGYQDQTINAMWIGFNAGLLLA
jgi:hypothetical protein